MEKWQYDLRLQACLGFLNQHARATEVFRRVYDVSQTFLVNVGLTNPERFQRFKKAILFIEKRIRLLGWKKFNTWIMEKVAELNPNSYLRGVQTRHVLLRRQIEWYFWYRFGIPSKYYNQKTEPQQEIHRYDRR
jgi:hypothetical protein